MLLGLDIGGTKCAVVLGKIETTGALVVTDTITVSTDKPAYEMIRYLFTVVDELLAKNELSIEVVEGIGISCGGPLSSKKGLILSPPNLPGWDNIPIVQMVEERFNKKAFLQNDANACAVAEWKYGAGKGYNNLIFLTFGTGMGIWCKWF